MSFVRTLEKAGRDFNQQHSRLTWFTRLAAKLHHPVCKTYTLSHNTTHPKLCSQGPCTQVKSYIIMPQCGMLSVRPNDPVSKPYAAREASLLALLNIGKPGLSAPFQKHVPPLQNRLYKHKANAQQLHTSQPVFHKQTAMHKSILIHAIQPNS